MRENTEPMNQKYPKLIPWRNHAISQGISSSKIDKTSAKKKKKRSMNVADGAKPH